MDAHVRNHSNLKNLEFEWRMHMRNKEKFILDISGLAKGPLRMPLANLHLHSNVSYRAENASLIKVIIVFIIKFLSGCHILIK